MLTVSALFKRNRLYFLAFIIFFISGIALLLIKGKAAAFISLNTYHPFLLNVFFINYTFFGDGIFALCLIAVMFVYFKKKQEARALLYSFLCSGLIVQLIKNCVDAPRPRLYFEAGQYLHFIDGVSLANHSSFPSGHTATAFAVATVLAVMKKEKSYQLLYFFAAVLVGYSRIYLAQHFLIDILAGAFIGIIAGMVSVVFASSSQLFRIAFQQKKNLSFVES